MKNFFNYIKLFKLKPVSTKGFLKLLLSVFLFAFLHDIIARDNDNRTFNIFFFGGIVSIILASMIKTQFEEITFMAVYPIRARKRVFYHFMYMIVNTILAFIIAMIFFLTIFGIIYLNGHVAFSTQETSNIELPLFYYAFAFSFSSFCMMLGHIRDNKKWWITFFVGILGYAALIAIVSFIFNGNLNFNNFSRAILKDKHNFLHYIFSVLLFASIYGFYELAVWMHSPKKPKNV